VPIPFIKIEGLGNDYLYVDSVDFPRKGLSLPSLSRAMSDRRRGVGSDGLIVIEKLDSRTAFMRVFNADGSEAKFCGNGLRGIALFMKTHFGARNKNFAVLTRWGSYNIDIVKASARAATVKAHLDSPSFSCREIGIRGGVVNSLGIEIEVSGWKRNIFCVAMPNPHAVIFVDNFDFDWRSEGAFIEKSRLFKHGVNVMFSKIESKKRITVIPWERGSGATSACGSGAAAATVISGLLGFTGGDVRVDMPGGSLVTRWDMEKNQIYQIGPTRIAFSGIYTL